MNPNQPDELLQDLKTHLELCRELCGIVERENQALRRAEHGVNCEFFHKKNLLPHLDRSLARLKQQRLRWQQLSPQERSARDRIPPLIREVQDLIMKIIVLDRENEQVLLRKGLIPARHLPSVNRQRPHYVANMYERHKDALTPPGSGGFGTRAQTPGGNA